MAINVPMVSTINNFDRFFLRKVRSESKLYIKIAGLSLGFDLFMLEPKNISMTDNNKAIR